MENIVQFLVADKASAIRVVQSLHHLSAESLLKIQDIYLVRRDRLTNKIYFSEANNLPTDDSIWSHPADPMTLAKHPFDFVNVNFSGDDTGVISDATFSEQIAQNLSHNDCMIVAHLSAEDFSVLESRLSGIALVKRLALNINENGIRSVASQDLKKMQRATAITNAHGSNMLRIDKANRETDALNLEIDKQRNYIKSEIYKMEDESAVAPWQENRDPLHKARQIDSPLPQALYKLDKSISSQDMANISHATKQKMEQNKIEHSLSERMTQHIQNISQNVSSSFDDAMSHLNSPQGLTLFQKLMMFFGLVPSSVKIRNNK